MLRGGGTSCTGIPQWTSAMRTQGCRAFLSALRTGVFFSAQTGCVVCRWPMVAVNNLDLLKFSYTQDRDSWLGGGRMEAASIQSRCMVVGGSVHLLTFQTQPVRFVQAHAGAVGREAEVGAAGAALPAAGGQGAG